MVEEVAWKDWYYENREGFNEARRQGYDADPAKREAARLAAQAYRDKRKQGQTVQREMTRVIGELSVPVFSSGAIADELGCSRQMLINWEERGWLPASTFPDKHRLYTKNQMELIELLHLRVKQAKRVGIRNLDERLAEVIKTVHTNWSL